MTEPTPAGWYPDPEDSGQQRYWDGSAWTEKLAPVSMDPPKSGTAKKPLYKRTWFIVVAVLIGLGVIANMTDGSTSTVPEPAPSATNARPQAEPEAKAAVAEPAPKPASAPKPKPEPAKPAMSMGQQQAVAKGESYLEMGGFSRKGLIEQLVFEKFSKDDATFAADHLDADWNEQAAKKAKSYVEMGGFSKQGLIEQLLYEGFSQAEAENGAKAAGY